MPADHMNCRLSCSASGRDFFAPQLKYVLFRQVISPSVRFFVEWAPSSNFVCCSAYPERRVATESLRLSVLYGDSPLVAFLPHLLPILS